MKLSFGLIAILVSSLFATSGMAATASFYATTIDRWGNQKDAAMAPDFMYKDETKNISINYTLGSNWVINSAYLWLRAVDDYTFKNKYGHLVSDHCAAPGANDISKCSDDNNSNTIQDPYEQAQVLKIEKDLFSNGPSVEINNFEWYKLNINVASYLSNTDKVFNATIKAIGGDFWYKNSKIVVNYSLKPVPVPAAVWLFGSALLGLIGKKRKSIAPAVA